MKKIFLLIGVVIPLLIIFVQSSSLRLLIPKPDAILNITDTDSPLILYIDNRLIGTLPLEQISVSPGSHTFSLYTVEGEEDLSIWWRDEIEVSSGDSLQIVIQSTSSDHISGIGLIRTFSSNGNDISSIFMDPNTVPVTVNGTQYTDFPVILTDVSEGTYDIATASDLYSNISLSLDIPKKTGFEVHIQLFFDYVRSVQHVSGLTIEPTLQLQLPIARRWDWQDQYLAIPAAKLLTKEWKFIDVYQMALPTMTEDDETLRTLEALFVKKQSTFRLPFGFVVTEDGHIYEGMGIWDFDFSSLGLSGITSDGSKCPILILGADVSPEQQKALNFISAFITDEPGTYGEVSSDLVTKKLTTEEVSEYEVTLKNTGWSTWKTDDAHAVKFKAVGSVRADVYHPDLWESPEIASKLTDPIVLPGAETSAFIPLKAPSYPITYTQDFVLIQDDVQMRNPTISVPIEVTGAGKGIEITDTPTGFLNVRETPSFASTLIGAVYPGERYLWLETQADWHKIRLLDGTEGWVNGGFIKDI
ncbi:SH3 domain-containing protein [candidate division WWE3 bacterium]|uniref:SH3 domain-containing protein n=1 Tax=candidate division WWE3 bacterium TaxID=2053526 RepID=A0A955LHE6_UNCKA|nr:SH3 domain-containing protein [candidate division WWE3 bacterium]